MLKTMENRNFLFYSLDMRFIRAKKFLSEKFKSHFLGWVFEIAAKVHSSGIAFAKVLNDFPFFVED